MIRYEKFQLFRKDWKIFICARLEAYLRLIITKTLPHTQNSFIIDFWRLGEHLRKELLHACWFFCTFLVGLLSFTVRDGYSETKEQYSSPCLLSLAHHSAVFVSHSDLFSQSENSSWVGYEKCRFEPFCSRGLQCKTCINLD